MFLRSLTLKGFKSFADATTLQLEPGVTVVVGPNGSGKSNVVDAIAWVLGAQAPSAVRSQKMDDVIFAGTAKRPALGRAEVALTIDNSAGLLPIEFTEVTVSRTLFRTGESEYAINGVNCRLLDVQELLSDAGVGRQQHVIVSQGQIDAVLNARPEDRRSIIEEAAGVLKYRRRKEKAERRLDATEASLLRVQDLLREVRRQLRPLERQAEAARRHGALIGELSGLQVFLAGREIAGLRQRLVSLTAERVDLGALDAELRGQLATLDAAVLAAEAELTARGDADLGDEMVRVEHVRERARGIAAVLVERRRSMERDRGQLIDAGVVANLEADAERCQGRPGVGRPRSAPGWRRRPSSCSPTRPSSWLDASSDDAPAAAPSNAAASAAAETRGELRTLRAAMERVEGEARRLAQRITQLGERAMRLDEQIVTRRAELDDAAGIEGGLVDQLEAAEHRRAAAEQRQATASAARLAAADGHARWQSRAEALRMALESARAKAGADLLTGVEGVVGTLLDVVEIDEGWEPAVEAALGEALQAVVVDSPTAGRRALEALRSSNVHGAVLALGATSPAGDRSSDERLVAGHVRSGRPGVADLVGRLLAGATRVGTWEEGLDLALARPEAVVVTEGGDRFGPTGWRLGAAGGGATAAALDEAQHRSSDAEAELHRWTAELTAADAELAEARRGEQGLTGRLDAHDAGFGASSDALADAQRDRRDVDTELATVQQQAAELDGRLGGERARIAELAELLPALEADEEAEAAAARARHAARAALDTEANRLAARRRELEVHDAGLHEREQLLERRLVETERRLAADAAARAEAHERRVAVERSITAIDRIAELVERHRVSIERRHGELQEARRRQSDEVRAIAQRLDDARRGRTETERQAGGAARAVPALRAGGGRGPPAAGGRRRGIAS